MIRPLYAWVQSPQSSLDRRLHEFQGWPGCSGEGSLLWLNYYCDLCCWQSAMALILHSMELFNCGWMLFMLGAKVQQMRPNLKTNCIASSPEVNSKHRHKTEMLKILCLFTVCTHYNSKFIFLYSIIQISIFHFEICIYRKEDQMICGLSWLYCNIIN
jgi:hypothetical protein